MLQLRSAQPSQIKNIATCHRECFLLSFSSKLGIRYVAKSLHWFVAAESRFLHYVTEADRVVGYCGGFVPQYAGDGSTSGMMQYAMREAALGMLKQPWLFFNKELIAFYPLIVKNIYRKLFQDKIKPVQATSSDSFIEKKVGLVVIGILPDYRGKGVFEMLMNEFEKETLKRKIQKMKLSVKKDNLRAIRAYQKSGWQVYCEHPLSFEMCKNIAQIIA